MQKFKLKLLVPVLVVSGGCNAAIENQQISLDQQQDCAITRKVSEYDKAFQSMRSIVGTINKVLQDFFSSKNIESTAVHFEKFKKVQQEQINKIIEELREISNDQPVFLEMIAYADSIKNQFKMFVDIVGEFKHQKPSHAMAFANKLKNSIDIKKLFTDIIAKLEKLQTKYATKDKNFADHLAGFIRTLRAIVNQWSNKDEVAMFQEITMRMSRK